MSLYHNLQGKIFGEPEMGSWYNLASGRKITKRPVGQPDYILNDNPRVAGTRAMIDQFLTQQIAIPTTSSIPAPETVSPNRVEINRVEEYSYSKPKSPTFFGIPIPKFLQHSADKEENTLYHPTSTDVETIPIEHLQMLCDFDLKGLRVKVRVLEVKDGDTCVVVFFCPSKFISSTREEIKLRPKETKVVRSAIGFEGDKGFFIRQSLRINGIDAAEHNTNKGKIAKKLLENKVVSLNNILYLNIVGREKFGRCLGDLYEDKDFTKNINDEILAYRHTVLGSIAVPYFGAKKAAWPSSPRDYVLEPEYK